MQCQTIVSLTSSKMAGDKLGQAVNSDAEKMDACALCSGKIILL